jgi:hypothetical protein
VPHETWRCPTCDREVEVETVSQAMRARGFWLPPSPVELRHLCARQHRAHRRNGEPLRALEPGDPLAHLRLARRHGEHVLVLDEVLPIVLRRAGDVYEAFGLDWALAASDLVGPYDRLIVRGRFLGVVLAGALRFVGDDHVDCPTLQAWQRSPASTSTSSPSGWTARASGADRSSRPS